MHVDRVIAGRQLHRFQIDRAGARPQFSLPRESDLRFDWIHVNLDAIDHEKLRFLVESAWASCVPKFVAREYAAAQGYV